MIEVSKGQKSYSGIGTFIPCPLYIVGNAETILFSATFIKMLRIWVLHARDARAVNLVTMEDGELKGQSLQDI